MEMQNVLTSLSDLCASPVAWGIVGVVALRAVWSAVAYFKCPLMTCHGTLDVAHARARVNARFIHSPRFLVSMLLGLALAIGGLYALRMPDAGPLALAAIVFGAFILLVEPSRLTVEDNEMRVVAASADGPEALALAQDRLRTAHYERIGMEFAMVAALAALVILL